MRKSTGLRNCMLHWKTGVTRYQIHHHHQHAKKREILASKLFFQVHILYYRFAAPRKHIQIHQTSYVQIFPIKALANFNTMVVWKTDAGAGCGTHAKTTASGPAAGCTSTSPPPRSPRTGSGRAPKKKT